MKFLSLFSGIGAFEKALDALGIPYELVGYCEIDKYASKSYSAIHDVPEAMNLGDITKIDEKALPKDIDLITYGFPCQDISIAGKQKGLLNEDGTQTRSGLFFEALRIIEETQPKVAIAENVKNLTGKKFKEQFQIVLASLETAGYNNYWQVLNAKDYGIPQNRERVFIVSIRKDIDTGAFKFPEGFPLELRLKDMLEAEVDEKYYLTDKMFKYAFNIEKEAKGIGFSDGVDRSYINPEIAQTIGCRSAASQRSGTTNYVTNKFDEPLKVSDMKKATEVRQIGNCCPTKTRDNPNQGRIYDTEGLSPCLNQMGGGNRQPFVVDDTKPIKLGFFKYPNSDKAHQSNTFYDANGVSPTLDTCTGGNRQVKIAKPLVYEEENDLRIRKLTPKECFRLMGFTDEDFAKAEAVNSNTQLYKQAGNSIVVDVIAHLFTHLKPYFEQTRSEWLDELLRR